jgi:hypothetical protein
MDLVTFAAERDAQLTSLADEYRPAVESALQEPVPEDRTAELVAAITVLFLLTYGDEGGNESRAREFGSWFVSTMRDALALTIPDESEAQVDRISTWLATATLGAATLKAAESNAQPGDELVKTWITMLDDKVRDTHQPLHGETQPMDGFFTVKTEPPADMQYPGQPVGPVEAWINCRCVLSISQGVVASGAKGGFSGVVIVALPEGDNMITYKDGDTTEMHQTLVYLGSTDQLQPGEMETIEAVGREIAASTAPFTARIAGLATLGEDQDTVAITEAQELQMLHEMARDNETVEAMYQERNGHPTWISHVTAQELQPGDELTFDRIGVWFGGDDHRTFEMGAPVDDTMIDDLDVMDETDDVPEVSEPIAAEDANMPVHGVIAPEGVKSGDGRSFAPGGTVWDDLPLPLKWQRADDPEHQGSVIVGKITVIERVGNVLEWEGELLSRIPEVEEVIYLIAEQALRGISVDMDDATVTQLDEAATPLERSEYEFAGRIRAATIVSIPAFPETYIALGPRPGSQVESEEVAEDEALAADARDATDRIASFKRGSGWITNPEDTARLHRYWTKGKGAAKIRWGTSGDFTRCTRQLRKYIDPQFLNRTCAQWHHDALGYWPGECGRPGNPPCGAKRGGFSADSEDFDMDTETFRDYDAAQRRKMAENGTAMPDGSYPIADVEDLRNAIQAIGRASDPDAVKRHIRKRAKALDAENLIPDTWSEEAVAASAASHAHTITVNVPNHSHTAVEDHQINLVAAAPPARVPAEWFSNPNLEGPTPLTVTPDGQVFGHIAKWGTCHIGIDKVCVTPPKSKQDYAYFHLGTIDTDGGELAVGSLTLGTGHADLKMSSTDTARHYDHTGTAVAKVRAGEDEHGIWVAGTICDGVTDEQVRTLRSAGGISGDWRSIGGNLELVAALAVNVPGFPVPRPALAASGGRQTALVAAGVVEVTDGGNGINIEAIAAAVVAKMDANKRRSEKLAKLDQTRQEARARRVAALSSVE